MEAISKLFVYGSLAPRRPNEHILSELGGSWEVARVRGILFNPYSQPINEH